MKRHAVMTLPHGLYRIWFVDADAQVLASVGSMHNGLRWYAPCNWTSGDYEHPVVASTDWEQVQRVELIADYAYDQTEEERESERMRLLCENAAKEGLRKA